TPPTPLHPLSLHDALPISFVAAHADGRPQPRWLPYGWRRFLRIVPAYWVALTATALLLGYHYVFHPRDAVTTYGFLQIYKASTRSEEHTSELQSHLNLVCR